MTSAINVVIDVVIDNQEYSFKHIDISKFKSNPLVLIIGRKKMGKTTDCINIISKKFRNCMDYNSTGYVVGNNDCLVKFIKKFDNIDGKSKLIIDDLETNLNNDSGYIVCDNYINFRFCDLIEKVSDCNKKLRVVTMDFPFYIKPEIVDKIDYIFIHNTKFYTIKRKLYNMYGNKLGNFRKFQTILDNLSYGYNCMVIDNSVKEGNLTDKVYWYNSYNNYRNHSSINKIIKQAQDSVDNNVNDKKVVDNKENDDTYIINKVDLVNIIDDYYKDNTNDIIEDNKGLTNEQENGLTKDDLTIDNEQENGLTNDGLTDNGLTNDGLTIDNEQENGLIKDGLPTDQNTSYFGQCIIL